MSHERIGRLSRNLARVLLVAVVIGALALLPSLRRFSDGDADAAPVSPYLPLYFAETGQTTSGPFLAYWLTHAETIGVPASAIVLHDGHWTQWFEYARLELHDIPFDQATGADITKQPVGAVFSDAIGYDVQVDAFQPKASGPERFFPDTGHSIGNGFRAAYEQPGVPEQLGPPISDEFSIGDTVFQFFEYGAFQWRGGEPVTRVAVGSLDAGLHGQLGTPQPMPEGAIDAALVRRVADAGAGDGIDLDTAFTLVSGAGGDVFDLQSFNLMHLADALEGERWIEIDLSDFTVTAWVGNVPVLREVTVTGHVNAPTPTGEFRVWLMYESQTMNGIGWNGQPYEEVNVPWVVYFYQDYAIHGTTWRTEFGYQDSQGCVIPPNDAAEAIHDFSYIGMRVVVHD